MLPSRDGNYYYCTTKEGVMSNTFEKVMNGDLADMPLEELEAFFAELPLVEITLRYYNAHRHYHAQLQAETEHKKTNPSG